jgi:lysophospholipase L1-like esterase
MATALGPDFRVFADGLNGRTTVFPDPVEGADKNGKDALLPRMEAHAPVDLVVIMLGTNDLKVRFGASASTIAAGAGELAAHAIGSGLGANGGAPRVLLIAPPPTRIDESGGVFGSDFDGADEKSKRFGDVFGGAAEAVCADFVDAAEHIRSSEVDGIHLSAEAQRALGRAVADWVQAQFGLSEPV